MLYRQKRTVGWDHSQVELGLIDGDAALAPTEVKQIYKHGQCKGPGEGGLLIDFGRKGRGFGPSSAAWYR